MLKCLGGFQTAVSRHPERPRVHCVLAEPSTATPAPSAGTKFDGSPTTAHADEQVKPWHADELAGFFRVGGAMVTRRD